MEIISLTPVSLTHVKKQFEKIKKRDEEPNFRVTRLEEYLNFFTDVTLEKSPEFEKKLTELKVPRLREQHIYKIIELLPETVDDLRTILQGFTITVSDANLKKIVDVVKEFHKTK